MVNSKKSKSKGTKKSNLKSVEVETKILVDEATGHLSSGIYDKALILYTKFAVSYSRYRVVPTMSESGTKADPEPKSGSSVPVVQLFTDILRPTLQDNDFLQSFVRIGLDDAGESRGQASSAEERRARRKESSAGPTKQLAFQEPLLDSRRASSRPRSSVQAPRASGKSVQEILQEEMKLQKSRKRRRPRSEAHRQEEVYTDKDRAAAVNMGSRDIKQSLKLKRKQDRSKALQIPEEAEPGSMLALGTRELRCGNVAVAINCINKALELSPNDRKALIARSKCHLLLGEPQRALEDAEAALRGRVKEPQSARALYAKAEALYHLGDFELSLVFYYRGMKIRPEFDQFRLGVQKAKEAIQNILADTPVPLPAKVSPDDMASARSKGTAAVLNSDGSSLMAKSKLPSSNSSVKRRRSRAAAGQELHLLRQLNADKRYLQNLLKRPGKEKRSGIKLGNADCLSESDYGYVHAVSGPVVVASRMCGSAMYEVVRVGHEQLLAEVIRLDGDDATLQVYEDTSGLTVGEPVLRTGRPLSIELGPGLLGGIYDGIQRPLREIQQSSRSVYLPKGLGPAALSRTSLWEFKPLKLASGSYLNPGDVIGQVYENKLLRHRIMLPPKMRGKLRYLAPAGDYSITEAVAELEEEEEPVEVRMLQQWPVREPRPVAERLAPVRPLLTGQRVLDGLFPVGQGASTALPGGFGCGKTAIGQALAKHSNSEVVVYVGCGERGNEAAELLRDFNELLVLQRHGGGPEPVIGRTVLVANASNMPVAGREASVYTGASIAEYFRDQGYQVALLADSTSRWAEALREIGARLGEMPAEAGYPAHLPSRLAGFYERAGRVSCLGQPRREGSLSLVGAISPPAGELSEPVAAASLRLVQAVWHLDRRLAERKHYPAVDWLSSYSRCLDGLADYYRSRFPGFIELRSRALELLRRQQEINELVQLIGRASLGEPDKLVLDAAALLVDDFLQQNGFAGHDRFCPFYKTHRMLRNVVGFYELARELLADRQLSWDIVKPRMRTVIYRIGIMKLLCPRRDGERLIKKELDELYDDMQLEFQTIREGGPPGVSEAHYRTR